MYTMCIVFEYNGSDVAYRKRLLPLTWRLLSFGGTGAQVQLGLLKQVAPYLPQQCRIHFYGDCEFRATALQEYCQARHWHWHAGLKGDTYVTLADGTTWQLRDLVQPGERRYWQDVAITKSNFGPVNLIAEWSPNQAYARFWSTDLLADPAA